MIWELLLLTFCAYLGVFHHISWHPLEKFLYQLSNFNWYSVLCWICFITDWTDWFTCQIYVFAVFVFVTTDYLLGTTITDHYPDWVDYSLFSHSTYSYFTSIQQLHVFKSSFPKVCSWSINFHPLLNFKVLPQLWFL